MVHLLLESLSKFLVCHKSVNLILNRSLGKRAFHHIINRVYDLLTTSRSLHSHHFKVLLQASFHRYSLFTAKYLNRHGFDTHHRMHADLIIRYFMFHILFNEESQLGSTPMKEEQFLIVELTGVSCFIASVYK